jgi:archaellum component FlaC
MARYGEPKKWEDLKDHEKIEDLRNDVKKLFSAVRDLYATLNAQSHQHQETDSLLRQVAKIVHELERKLAPSKKGG